MIVKNDGSINLAGYDILFLYAEYIRLIFRFPENYSEYTQAWARSASLSLESANL